MSGVSKLIGNTWVDETDVVPMNTGISEDFKVSLQSMAQAIIESNKVPSFVDIAAPEFYEKIDKKTAEYKIMVNCDWIDDREQLKKIIEDLSGQIATLTKDNEEFADGLIEQEETIEKLKKEINELKRVK